MRKPQVVPDEDHEVIYERVAAVDVAKASGVVCLRTPDPARPGRFVNRIWDNVPAMRAQIAELGAELLRCRVQMVTLESTSDYWRIWYYVLESLGLAVQLVSASQAKNLKGRPKTDKLDAMWLARLTQWGMLRPSFVPPAAIRRVRDFTRARQDLVADHLGGQGRDEGQVGGGDGGRAGRRPARPARARGPGQGAAAGQAGPARSGAGWHVR